MICSRWGIIFNEFSWFVHRILKNHLGALCAIPRTIRRFDRCWGLFDTKYHDKKIDGFAHCEVCSVLSSENLKFGKASTRYFVFFKLLNQLKGFVWFPICRCWQVCLGWIRRWTNGILYIKLTVPLFRIWTQQRINSKITYRVYARTWKFSQNYLGIFQKFHKDQNWVYACKSWCKCILQFQCSVSYHWIFTEITYMGTWNKFLEHVSTFTFNSLNWFCKLTPSALIRYFCENSMITYARLVLTDTFAPLFASIQWILDSMDFFENSEAILSKFSSSWVFILSLS